VASLGGAVGVNLPRTMDKRGGTGKGSLKSKKVTVMSKKVVSLLRKNRVTLQNWQTVMTKKVVSFFRKGMTPSVAAPRVTPTLATPLPLCVLVSLSAVMANKRHWVFCYMYETIESSAKTALVALRDRQNSHNTKT